MVDTNNKKDRRGALVGNWLEEDALRERTGYSHRKIPAPLFAPDRIETRHEPTYKRVILHETPAKLTCNSHASEMTPPPFETTFQASTRYADFATQKLGPGPRNCLRDQHLADTARRLHSEQREREREREALERQAMAHVTVAKSSFLPVDPSALVTKRVPRGLNGSLSRQVDPSIQHLTKGEIDSIDQMKLDLLQDTPVTKYSYAVATGVGLDFPTTVSDGNNVFGRSSAFTNELNDSTKRHGEATEPGWVHHERLGTSVHQRSALKKLLNLLKAEPGTAHNLLDTMKNVSGVGVKPERLEQHQHEEEEPAYVELHEFRAAFARSRAASPRSSVVSNVPVILTDKEVIHIFMYFDIDNIGAIQFSSFRDYCTSLGEKVPFTYQYTSN